MLRFFHSNQKHVSFILFLSVIVLAMSGFGVDFYQRNSRGSQAAITIDDTEIGYDEVRREIETTIGRYRAIFGKNVDALLEQFNVNVPQQAVDRLIDQSVVRREGARIGFAIGEQQVSETIRRDVFGGNFSEKQYLALLRSNGLSRAKFEGSTRDLLLYNQIAGVLGDAANASQREARARYVRDQTSFGVSWITVDPVQLESKVAAPNEDEVKSYYEEHQSEFEVPARAAFEFVRIRPVDLESAVEIFPEDVELYYTENQSEFTLPERVNARHVLLSFPKDADTKKMVEVKERANEVLGKAQAGESFESLALRYSDDIASKTTGGGLGWITRGERSPEFDQKVFALKGPGIAGLVSTEYGYQVVKVDAYEASKLKPLSEVRAGIEATIRRREAPAYALAKAQDLFDGWKKEGSTLADFAAKNKLSVGSSKGLVSSDPVGAPEGLAKQVVEGLESALHVELPAESVLVSVSERKETDIAQLSEVRELIVARLRKERARAAAREKADAIVAKLRSKEFVDLQSAGKVHSLKVESESRVTVSTPGKGVLVDPQLREQVFSVAQPGSVLDPRELKEGFAVVVVNSITLPDLTKGIAEIERYRAQQSTSKASTLVASFVDSLKARATINVREDVVGIR